MAYLTGGLSGQDMIDMCLTIGVNLSGKAVEDTAALRYINLSQLELWNAHDWAALRHADDYFTTDGSTSYDLSSALNDEDKAGFGRIRDKTVRVGTWFLEPISKEEWDQRDPDRTDGGKLHWYASVSRTDFRVLPYGSSGETVYLDWIELPVQITADTAATDVSFPSETHEAIVRGAIWRMMLDYDGGDWSDAYGIAKKFRLDAIKYDTPVRYGSRQIKAITC